MALMSMTLSTIHQRKISNVPMAKHPGKFFNIPATLWQVWEGTLTVNYTGTQSFITTLLYSLAQKNFECSY